MIFTCLKFPTNNLFLFNNFPQFYLATILILLLGLTSCREDEIFEYKEDDNEKYYHKYKDEELGYFRGNISPLIGGDMRNLIAVVKLYADNERAEDGSKSYKIKFGIQNYGLFLQTNKVEDFMMAINLAETPKPSRINITLNKTDDINRTAINSIYTAVRYKNPDGNHFTTTYIPKNKPLSIFINKVYDDPYYPVPVIEGSVEGELSNPENKEDVLHLKFDFRSRYYEESERN